MTSPATTSQRRSTNFVWVAATLVLVVGVVAVFMFVLPALHGSGGAATIDYATEQGVGSTAGTVNSPLRITLNMPNTVQDSTVNTATVQLLDSSGNPAYYGDQPAQPFPLQAQYQAGVWAFNGSMPTKPGTYHPHVQLNYRDNGGSGASTAPQALDFPDKPVQATAESAPLTSGFIFERDSNIWILSTDIKRERQLTFFNTAAEFANDASWSPDGKTIVFAHTPQTAMTQLPAGDLWTMHADGSGAKLLLAHGDNESLYDPSYSPDGKYVYFTAEKLDMASTNYDATGQPVGERNIDRYEIATEQRTQWKSSAHLPVWSGSSDAIVYLGDQAAAGSDPNATAGSAMVRAAASGGPATVLADNTTFTAFYGPAFSPDNTRVAFAAIEVPPSGSVNNPVQSFFKWLLFQPDTAYAHGLPWDVYLVGADGKSKAIRLTSMQEDQPHPAWLGNSTIAFMGVTGLYKLQIGVDGNPLGKPTKVHDGASHGGLSWHAP